jgi:hypothetical protein
VSYYSCQSYLIYWVRSITQGLRYSALENDRGNVSSLGVIAIFFLLAQTNAQTYELSDTATGLKDFFDPTIWKTVGQGFAGPVRSAERILQQTSVSCLMYVLY